VSTQQEVQEELREPTRCIMRRNHLESQMIDDLAYHVQTWSSLRTQGHTTLISNMKRKHIDEAIQDDNWVKAMQDDLDQFQKNDGW